MSVQIAGGIGLFLLGMILITDGIKAAAGDSLRRGLIRFTGSPLRAFVSGFLVTMLIQSSSATTLAVIGFVSAGLLTFSQAFGVVIGASLGTTGSGWLVSLLGLKFSLGTYALPLVVVGAFLKLLGRGRWRMAGLPLAGFGLIFVGIDTLQRGMSGAATDLGIASWQADVWYAPLFYALVGIALTVVTQSSSAAIATVLTALHTHSINFDQAAALTIGAAIGTTGTSILAAIGSSVSAKRTALAHVIFNLASGLLALLLLPLLLRGIHWAQQTLGLPEGPLSLSLFHTAFLTLGAVLFLPWIGPISRWIERLLPEVDPPLTRHLDSSVLSVPEVALEAGGRALKESAAELFDAARRRLAWANRGYHDSGFEKYKSAIWQIQEFLSQIQHLPADQPMAHTHVRQIHAIDHLLRLTHLLEPAHAHLDHLDDPKLSQALQQTTDTLRLAGAGLRGETDDPEWLNDVRQTSLSLSELRRRDRLLMLQATALGSWDPDRALGLLDTVRWLDRISYHAWRISHHLSGGEVEFNRLDGPGGPLGLPGGDGLLGGDGGPGEAAEPQ